MNGDDIGYAQYLEEQARQEEEQREWEESEAAAAQAEAETGAMEMEIKEEKMASKWEEKVMGDDAILERLGGHWENFLVPVWRKSLLLAQAEITGEEAEKRGAEKVVDWIRRNSVTSQDTAKAPKFRKFGADNWQAFLKDLGIE